MNLVDRARDEDSFISRFDAVFRVDASSLIGSGHVMRCLTLAQEIKDRGGDALFVCRTADGDLVGEIQRRGFVALPMKVIDPGLAIGSSSTLDHADWLAGGWRFDVEETIRLLTDVSFDWLIIDHYGIDCDWESEFKAARPMAKVACIDDLADREHKCDLLVDQNLGRCPGNYTALVPLACTILVGTRYALLRPEFRALRAQSLARRRSNSSPKRVFVNLGGVDLANSTVRVIEALAELPEASKIQVDVVLGGSSPHIESVRETARTSPLKITVYVNTPRIAELMVLADVAIGAGGGTSWERCTLGLPSMVLGVASNQRGVVKELANYGVAYILEEQALTPSIIDAWGKFQDTERLLHMSIKASQLVTGDGATLVVDALEKAVRFESAE